MQKWEYMTLVHLGRGDGVNFSLTDECNKLGEVGWELICLTPETEGQHSMLFFKRPKL
jgi:hypothetical protein